jgi:hypothetical protein
VSGADLVLVMVAGGHLVGVLARSVGEVVAWATERHTDRLAR